jgi:hypothetical protein
LDTNLVVLLVVGSASPAFIDDHKRLGEFTRDDFDRLVDALGVTGVEGLCVPVNVVAEASNLIVQGLREPRRSQIAEGFTAFINAMTELYVASKNAVLRPELTWLGLTDCALIEATGPHALLLTADSELYAAALGSGRTAVYFKPQKRRD